MARRVYHSIVLSLALAAPVHAVIVYDLPTRNVATPTGSWLEAWNLQGQFGNFIGTPISPTQFIVAKHIGVGPGDFYFQNQVFTAVSAADIPGSDLRVWTIDTQGGTRTFPGYAPLYDASLDGSEVGKPLVVFGRGTQRGTAITAPIDAGAPLGPAAPLGPNVLTGGSNFASLGVSGPTPQPPGELRGWRWGFGDGAQSWGQNIVDAVLPDDALGDFLTFDFDGDATRVPNEAALSVGDSSGGVFIMVGGAWKLAGVNYGVDGNWSLSADGQYESAAIFDARGLWAGTSADHGLVNYDNSPVPASSYATRISAHVAEIEAITAGITNDLTGGGIVVPEPASLAGLACCGLVAVHRRRRIAGG